MGPDDAATEILPGAAAPARVVEPAAASAPAAAGSLIGRTLGKFDVLEQLGRGGSGDVYRAEQTQLGRSAVIKVLRRDGHLSPIRIDRFLREAKLASRLDHPYAAHIYAFGAEPDGILWIAMEHVRGATLDELVVRRGPIPPAIFGPLFARLCEVVHTAHELGIVHRDIKGSNVMVIERAGQLLPKLIDLGIAKGLALEPPAARSVDAEGTPAPEIVDEDERLTEHGATLGSPHYMSPEQWTDASSVDARADVYALGILAYRCVAGSVPFRFTDRGTLVDAHLRRPPPPLPERVPAPLAEAVLHALEKDPAARWQTALAFGNAVQRAVGTGAQEIVPIFDPYTRDVWLRAGPQPIADAVAHVASATTTVEADAAVRELVAITCRWLAVLALSGLPRDAAVPPVPAVREGARGVVGRDDAGPWLELARVAVAATGEGGVPGLLAALAGSEDLAVLADRLDDRDRVRSAAALTADVEDAALALRPIEPLLAYQLVVGRPGGAESWQGPRRRDRERVLVWGEPLADGEVALLDSAGTVVVRLSPLAQVIAPLPSAEPELFLLWRSGRGVARLVAAPWGFERDDDAAGERLAALTTEDSDTAHDAADDVSPYPGLAAYRTADAERFVGREREVEALANRLIRAPMIAVLGPSGAGKSSFIHAGVLPRLAEQYRVVTLRPGRHPMHALAAVPEVSSDSQDDRALAGRLRELGESAPRGLVIVIDQLEELVTLCGDPAERARFADTLAAAADATSSPVRVVVTLRDDFAAVIESEAAFRGKFEVFVLGTPLPEALRRIVIEPARRAAVAVDPAVVDDMVAEVAGRPASLPLLSFTAAQLWDARDKVTRRITRESYIALGGVAGALSTYADQIYDSLARRDQAVVRTLFARLVAGDGTRIPAPRRELEQLPGARAVLAHLVDARLLVVREDEDRDIVEIVHECLAERWDRLARWRREDATDRALVGDVRAAARRWLDTHRRPDALWRGEALAELRRLVARDVALTDDERAFAAASDLAARRARRLRRGAVIAAMLLLVALAAAMAALSLQARDSADKAERSEAAVRAASKLVDDSLTKTLVTQGRVELNDGRELPALAYFAAALRRGADTPGLRFMIRVASRAWRSELVVDRKGTVSGMIPTPDGGFLVGTHAGALRWYGPDAVVTAELPTDIGDTFMLRVDAQRRVLAIGHDAILVLDAAHRPLGRFKVTTGVHSGALGPGADELTLVVDDGVTVVDFTGAARRHFASERPTLEVEPMFLAGHVVLGAGPTAMIVDLTTMTAREIAHDLHGLIAAAPDGSALAYPDKAGVIHVLAPDGTPRFVIHPPATGGLSFSLDSARIVSGTPHEVALYDRKTGALIATYNIDLGGSVVVQGEELWTGSDDGRLRHYHGATLVASLPTHTTAINFLELSGTLVASIGSDSTFAIHRADDPQLVFGPDPCANVGSAPAGIGTAYMCSDGRTRYYAGGRVVGETPAEHDIALVITDPVTGRAAVTGGNGSDGTVEVYDRDARQIGATSDATGGHGGLIAFDGDDHLLILDSPGPGALWRWAYRANTWERLIDVVKASSIGTSAAGTLVGYADGKLVTYVGTRPVHELELGEMVEYQAATQGGAWVAIELASGVTVILDGKTSEVVRRLEASDSTGFAPMFDRTGELLLRTARGTTTIWERATGDDLVFNLDLLHTQDGISFGSGSELALQGAHIGTIDFGRDTRPAADLVHDIECRVPFAVRDGKLQPTAPTCAR